MAEPDALGGLLEHLRLQAHERRVALEAMGLAADDYPRLPAVDEFRCLWSRLRSREQLRAALAPPPAEAGPLNSARLAQRALALMHEASPGYLQHFMAWLDALSWLERMQAEGRSGPRQAAGKRPRRPPASNPRARKRRS